MKLKIEIDTEKLHSLNLLGELLRNEFFDQRKGVGCYSTFELRSGVVDLGVVETKEGVKFNKFGKKIDGVKIGMLYWWDGDGTLVFMLPDMIIKNRDCKKDYGWEIDEEFVDD